MGSVGSVDLPQPYEFPPKKKRKKKRATKRRPKRVTAMGNTKATKK